MPSPSREFLDLIAAYRRAVIEFPALKPVTVAQWIVESGWGTSELATRHHNFGGLKYRESMKSIAREVVYSAHDGVDKYCAFASVEDFIQGYWMFIDRAPYAGWRKHVSSGEDYISFIGPIYTPSKSYVETVLSRLHDAEALLSGAYAAESAGDYHLASHGSGGDVGKPEVNRNVPTSHKSSRDGQKIDHIVLHYTTSRNIEGAIETFLKGRIDERGRLIRTSAHYIVGRDGELVQMVNDSDMAWHAGQKLMNARSIGIEHCANETDRLTPEQEATSVALVRWLVDHYEIPLENVIPHDAVHSTSCPGKILANYGDNHAAAVRNWVEKRIAPAGAPPIA